MHLGIEDILEVSGKIITYSINNAKIIGFSPLSIIKCTLFLHLNIFETTICPKASGIW